MQKLNNLVTELLNLEEVPSGTEARFVNPREGWVFIRGGDKVVLDDAEVPLAPTGAGTGEAMRFLPAGEHRVRVEGSVELLIVRAVPELIFCKFQYDPHVRPHGPYDWAFLQKHVLDHVNCIVGDGSEPQRPMVEAWKRQGKRWLVECLLPGLRQEEPVTADEAYTVWTQNVGLRDPLIDGIIVDEFLGGKRGNDPKYYVWMEAMQRIRANEALRGKHFYPYCNALYGAEPSEAFIRATMAAGYRFAWEQYLKEPPTEEAAREQLAALTERTRGWLKAFPGCAGHMVMCLGYMSVPPESVNADPKVDYKVWMDAQFHHLANDPAFEGLYGLMEYTCGYADEETVRWAARLYRHYGIEGQTEMLSPRLGFQYRLEHVDNPDFEEGTKGWAVRAAEEGGVEAGMKEGWSWLQGRYPRTTQGDTFLKMRRSSRGPNAFSQEIKHLRPGRLYSLKMFTADHRAISEGRSKEQRYAVSIQVEGAERVSEKSFQHVMHNCYSHSLGPFNAQHRAWMNYHFEVFRAKAERARLTVSDWADAAAPGGPAGQELMFNFIEVQPYLE